MATQTVRRWSALAAVVCSLLLAALLAHGLREAIEVGHDHSVQSALAVCFVVAALFAPLALSAALPRERSHRAAPILRPRVAPFPPAPSTPGARVPGVAPTLPELS